jgi:DNA replication protein DnaC
MGVRGTIERGEETMKRLGDALKGGLPNVTVQPGTPGVSTGSECPVCKGAGYLRAEVPYGHPFFGRLLPCECRALEADKRDFEELQQISNLEPFRDKTFATFDSKAKGVEAAYKAAKKYAEDPRGWLLLMGGYGCGKTHLAAAIANYSIFQKRFMTFFTIVPDLLDHLRSTFGPHSEIQYDELFDKVRTTPLIVLDDLGTENATPWAREKLYQIFNYRYNYEYLTVITTNRDLRDIDDRIRSRLQDDSLCKIIKIEAADYRPRQAGERARRPKSRQGE